MDNNPNQKQTNHLLQLVINGKKYDWHSQYITGAEIKTLGKISNDEGVYLQIKEPWSHEPVPDDMKINLARPSIEHFFSKAKPIRFDIIVNGTIKEWNEKKINFIQVVGLAYETINTSSTYTVAYDRGPHENKDGTMIKGDSVFVKNKMIFNVTGTHDS